MCAINAATSIFTPAFGSNFELTQAQPIDFQDSYTSYCFALLFHKPQYLINKYLLATGGENIS
jgi:hypothetical protein